MPERIVLDYDTKDRHDEFTKQTKDVSEREGRTQARTEEELVSGFATDLERKKLS